MKQYTVTFTVSTNVDDDAVDNFYFDAVVEMGLDRMHDVCVVDGYKWELLDLTTKVKEDN